MTNVIVTTFYHFINLPHFEEIKEPLMSFCKAEGLKGTILLAKEGVNSTISGSRKAIDSLYKYLLNEIGIRDLVYKESFHENQPFNKMKINLKKEIVALGVEDLDVEGLKGEYISPKDWDSFISQDDVIVIDTRNKYETLLGSFEKAIDPNTANFRQFPKWVEDNLSDVEKEKKIAMFCTGGVRCEKSTAYLKSQGFKNVYHLEGGILKYFEDTEAKTWHGSCFVFDDRVALNKKLEADKDLHCGCCDKSLDTDDIRRAALANKMICLQCVEHA
jgi:UPF0176 protein